MSFQLHLLYNNDYNTPDNLPRSFKTVADEQSISYIEPSLKPATRT